MIVLLIDMLVGQKLQDNNRIGGSPANTSTETLCIKWHPVRDFLGVSSFISSKGGFVSFFTKEGGKPCYASSIKDSQRATALEWHPEEPLLAVGWNLGIVELIDVELKTR